MQYYTKKNVLSEAGDQVIQCSKKTIRELLLQQWHRLTPGELEETGYVKSQLAMLIQCKYGIHSRLMENYLSNLERTLPVSA